MTEQRREPGSIIEAVHRARGYTLPLHSVLAAEDPDVLAAYENMMNATGDRQI